MNKKLLISENELLDCMKDSNQRLKELEHAKYTNRYAEKNLITSKCTKRYGKWLEAYSNFYSENCLEGKNSLLCKEMSESYNANKDPYRIQLENTFKFATNCEDTQFLELLDRVDQGTLLKEVSCPFKNMKT